VARKLFRADLLTLRPSAAGSVAHVLTQQVPASYPGTFDLSSIYAEIEDVDGDPLPRGELRVDRGGELPRFYGPDGVDSLFVLYADASGPPYTAIEVAGVVDPADGSGSSVPVPTTGDTGKVVTVNEAEDGYELRAPGGASGVPFLAQVTITGGFGDIAFGAPGWFAAGAMTAPVHAGDLVQLSVRTQDHSSFAASYASLSVRRVADAAGAVIALGSRFTVELGSGGSLGDALAITWDTWPADTADFEQTNPQSIGILADGWIVVEYDVEA
jgi:hypothetical protein